jgi:hypothetical protein
MPLIRGGRWGDEKGMSKTGSEALSVGRWRGSKLLKPGFRWVFAAVAMVFVPVWFYFGLVDYVVPAACGLIGAIGELRSGDVADALFILIYTGMFLAVFLYAGRGIERITRRIPQRGHRWSCQLFVILLLGLFTLPRVITYSSIQGSGGTYNFWEAIERFAEKRAGR